MSQQHLHMEQFFAAPREKVFAYFADHEKLGRIFGGRFTRIKDAGDRNDPNGLGSVREIRNMGLRFEETVVAYDKPSVIEYTVSKGGPIKNHLGRMEFHSVDGGTKLNYTIRFEPRLPLTGGLLAGLICSSWHAGVHRAVKDIAAA